MPACPAQLSQATVHTTQEDDVTGLTAGTLHMGCARLCGVRRNIQVCLGFSGVIHGVY